MGVEEAVSAATEAGAAQEGAQRQQWTTLEELGEAWTGASSAHAGMGASRRRKRGGAAADGTDALLRAGVPGAYWCRTPERYRRDGGNAAPVMTKLARPMTRTRRSVRPPRGRVDVEPSSAAGEPAVTSRRR